MKKVFFLGCLLFMTTAIFAQDSTLERRRPGCRQWTISIFGYTILEHNLMLVKIPMGIGIGVEMVQHLMCLKLFFGA